MKFKLLSSKEVFDGKAVNVWLDRVRYPDGYISEVEVVRHPGAVTILPIDEAGLVWFVRQYRHPVGERLLELPAGTLEVNETPSETAAREIREEIGMSAQALKEVGRFFMAPGYSTELMVVYIATGLTAAPLDQDDGEQIIVEKYPLDDVYQMINDGLIRDAKTVAAFMVSRNSLEGIGRGD